VYRHPRLIAMRQMAQGQLKRMFERYCAEPAMLPPHFQARARSVGLPRAAGDYLAGMTDRFCQQTYRALTDDHQPNRTRED
jgi:dGTPase